MGCISPSASGPQFKSSSSKKIHDLKSRSRITQKGRTSHQIDSSQKQRTRRKVNKVQFISQAQSHEPTQNIVLSCQQFTIEDKEMLNQVLSKNYIFHKLSHQDRKQVIDKFLIYDSAYQGHLIEGSPLVESDPYLFKKNDIGTMFFVIKSGNVQIELDYDAAQQNHKKIFYGRGDSFGELALLYKTVRSASVKCFGKCTFLCLSSQVFRQIMQNIVERTIQNNKILIERIPLFQYLTPKQKNKLANNIIMLKYETNDIVFREGDDSPAFFVIISGKVKIQVKNKPLLQLKNGEYFGQSCFQQNAKRSGTVQCIEKTQLMSISRLAFKKIFGEQNQQFYYFSILKWALKRNPVLSRISSKSIQKLLKQSDVIHFANDQKILKDGQKIRKLYIPIEGSINEFEMGDIVNFQYLNDIQRDKKTPIFNTIALIKKKSGYVCVMDINKVLSLLQKHFIVIATLNSRSFEDMKKAMSSKKQIQQTTKKLAKQIRENNSYIRMQNITMVKKIGNGQFGSIYKVRHTLDNSFYALKTFNKCDVQSYKMRHFIKQEVDVMQMIGNHKFIVQFQKYFQSEEYLLILMELIDGKDFFDTILEIGWLRSDQIQFFFASFILALEFLHDNDIIYRDIKPQNAVIQPSGYLKLIDLGTARKLNPKTGYRSFTIIGTPHYMAPQVVAGKGYSFEADIWSLGVLLYQLACGRFPFGQKLEQPIQIYNQIIKPSITINYPEQLTDVSLKRLIERLLVKDPSIREIQNFGEIKQSEFYQNFEWQKFESKALKPPYKPERKNSVVEQLGDIKKSKEQTLINFLQRLKIKSRKNNHSVQYPNWDEF